MNPIPHKVLLPVIHAQSLTQVLKNCEIAIESKCDGVFVINHETQNGDRELKYNDLISIVDQVAKHFPDLWIGVNCLDLTSAEVFQHLSPAVKGVWVDNGEIDEQVEVQPAAEAILSAKKKSGWDGLYFGGVAFKYQRPVSDSAKAAVIAQHFIDVVTTSGPGTAESASIDKIQGMKQAIEPAPLAIASGITPDNVQDYLPWIDYFLVATGISDDFYNLNREKTSHLAKIVHAF